MSPRRTLQTLIVAFVLPVASAAFAQEPTLDGYARDALSDNAMTAAAAITALRDAGPDGLEALFDTHAGTLATLEEGLLSGKPLSPKLARLREALDAVAQQRDAFSSRLFWHTDLEAAQSASRASGKPILSLRLLGHLDEELSCANSRFFRTVLYTDPSVSETLRESFVLHWSSERPVPVATIDYGDGRVLTRTITGNSIHYVLDAEGRVLDAFPGLYSPSDFTQLLATATTLHSKISDLSPEERPRALAMWHRDQAELSETALRAQLASVGAGPPPNLFANPPSGGSAPPAIAAAPRAVGKAVVEVDIVAELGELEELDAELADWALGAELDPSSWDALIEETLPQVQLSAESVRHMRIKHRSLSAPDEVLSEEAIAPVVDRFRRAIAEDTLQNRYQLYVTMQRWLAEGDAHPEMETLNTQVYETLFLTPASDPWLGLAPDQAYSGLEGMR